MYGPMIGLMDQSGEWTCVSLNAGETTWTTPPGFNAAAAAAAAAAATAGGAPAQIRVEGTEWVEAGEGGWRGAGGGGGEGGGRPLDLS